MSPDLHINEHCEIENGIKTISYKIFNENQLIKLSPNESLELFKIMKKNYETDTATIPIEEYSELRKYGDIIEMLSNEEIKILEEKFIREHNQAREFPY